MTRRFGAWLAATSVLVALLATFAIGSAHDDPKTPPPPPSSQAQAGPAHIRLSDTLVELSPDAQGYSGSFEIENTGVGTLSITRIWIPSGGELSVAPAGTGVVLEQAGKSALIAPGQKRKAIVTWTGQSRVRELYGHVLIASNAVDPKTKELLPPVAVGIHAEKAGGIAGWLGRHVLSLLLLVPLLGVGAIAAAHVAKIRDGRRVRQIALAFAALEVVLAGWLFAFVDRGMTAEDGHRGYQFIEKGLLVPSVGVHYFVGIDGISAPFIALAALLGGVAAWIAREDDERATAKAVWMLLTATAAVGVFVALDLMLMWAFYVVLVVTIAFWVASSGGEGAQRAAVRFGAIGLAGAVFLLSSFLWLGIYGDTPYLVDGSRGAYNFSIPDLEIVDWVGKRLRMEGVLALKPLAVGLVLGFGALVPLVPVHTWLPAVTEKGARGAAVVALGVVTKIGVYGLLRVGVGIVPRAMAWAAPGLAALAVVAVVYGALVAFGSRDLKRLIGVAATSQMGLALLGVAAMTPQGFEGAIAVGVAHGLAAPVLLLLVGELGDRAHTTRIDRFGGMAGAAPRWSALTTVALFASIGVPGLIGFWGDFLVFFGAFPRYRVPTIIAASGIAILAAVQVWTWGRVLLGRLRESWATSAALAASGGKFPDLSPSLRVAAGVLLAFSLLLGIWPRPLLDAVDKRVLELHRRVDPPGHSQIASAPPPRPLRSRA